MAYELHSCWKCNFKGGNMLLRVEPLRGHGNRQVTGYAVTCHKCGISAMPSDTEEEAVRLWNRQPDAEGCQGVGNVELLFGRIEALERKMAAIENGLQAALGLR